MHKFTDSIYLATSYLMHSFDDLAIFGLGVSYPNGADGTMGQLGAEFPNRVLDTPASESTVTGLAVGAAISGKRTLVHHGRVEFALFAADQIVTQAANWNYMFGGNSPVPVTFRIAIGRQWGNGPQHTGSHIPLFSSTPGLKVVCPSSPKNAYYLLLAAVQDKNPVVFLEPRWLYQMEQEFEPTPGTNFTPSSQIAINGDDITLVSFGEGVLECALARRELSKIGISAEVIDLLSISPLDHGTVLSSVKKTRNLIVVDPYSRTSGIGTEIVWRITQEEGLDLKSSIVLLTPPFTPVPTANSLTEVYYAPVRAQNIISESAKMLGRKYQIQKESFEDLHLAPKIQIGENWEIL
jgi:pyruvate dehydrogenase E1 component beta subunit